MGRLCGPCRRAFTLIEMLMVVTILSILAVVVVIHVKDVIGTGRAESMSATVGHVREVLAYRSATGAQPLAGSGWPTTVDGSWFTLSRLPTHTWTRRPMIVETVNGAAADVYPAVKTFNGADPAAANAWYNVTNGAFCVRVLPESTDAKTLHEFNVANNASVTTLAQTTW